MSQNAIYLFCGEDTYSSYQKANFWKQEFQKKYGEFNTHVFEGANLDASELLSAIESVPFLSEKKFILVRDFLRDGKEADQKMIAEELPKVPDFTVLVFIENEKPDARTTLYKKLKTVGQLQPFEAKVEGELESWIKTQMNQKKASIGPRETRILAETVGPNLWQMSQEIEKLTLHANGNPITAEDIEALTSPNITTSVFKLTDALSQKNPKGALKMLKILLESGEDLIKVIFMIVRHFRILLQVRACLDKKMDKAQITQKLKEHPYVIMTAMTQAKSFDLNILKTIYRNLLNLDSDLKSGKIKTIAGNNTELRLAVEKFIVGLAQ